MFHEPLLLMGNSVTKAPDYFWIDFGDDGGRVTISENTQAEIEFCVSQTPPPTESGNWLTSIPGVPIAPRRGRVYFRGTAENEGTLFSSNAIWNAWTINGTSVRVGGNINTLLSYTRRITELGDYAFCYLFRECEAIVDASALTLSAKNLASYCYYSMFEWCTSLTQAPALPATTLADSCYMSMFGNCTGLTHAPELPVTTLADSCYRYMFIGCRGLRYMKCLAVNLDVQYALNDWVQGVSATGTFVKKKGVEWPTGDSGIPSGWTVQEVD